MKRICLAVAVVLSMVLMPVGVSAYFGDYSPSLRTRANAGNVRAMVEMGFAYNWGNGVTANNDTANEWFRKAAERGDGVAMQLLGVNLTWSTSDKDNAEGRVWLRKSFDALQKEAAKGDALSQRWLAVAYEYGRGCTKDLNLAHKWYVKSADQGNAAAQLNLAEWYHEGKVVPKDLEMSFELATLSAQQGYNFAKEFLKNELKDYKPKDLPQTLAELNKGMDTWETFCLKNGVKLASAADIQAQIQADVDAWQKKGEFETTAEWQGRVNDQTRQKYIDDATRKYSEQYERELGTASKKYKDYREGKLSKFYAAKRRTAESGFKSGLSLQPYDADHQSFLIHSDKYGDMLLPVDRPEAPAFKSDWDRVYVQPDFVPNGDDVALSKVTFKLNGKSYVYDGKTEAKYAIADIDYNFEPVKIDFSSIKIEGAVPQGDLSQKVVSKDVISRKDVAVERNKLQASAKSDVDVAIPQTAVKAANTFAVIIANENYRYVSPVTFAVNDGQVLAKYLNSALGIPQDHIKIFRDATQGDMSRALKHVQDLGEAWGQDLNLIFYYAGHGVPDEGSKQSLLLPVDGDAAIAETCVPVKKVYDTLGSLRANSVVVLMDACFSGAQRDDNMLMAARGVKIKPQPNEPKGQMVVFSAAQGDETAYSYDPQQHGMFTYFLLKKLQETKGQVTLGELSDYLTQQVKRQSLTSNGKLQTPQVQHSPTLGEAWRTWPLAR